MKRMTSATIHWLLRGTAVVAVYGMVGTDLSGRVPGTRVEDGCTTRCEDGAGDDNCCSQCHSTYSTGTKDAINPHGVCYTSSCYLTGHVPCSIAPAELPQLTDAALLEAAASAIDAADMTSLSRLLTAAPRRVSVNYKRGAIQVMDCSGVMAHLPVPSTVLTSLQ